MRDTILRIKVLVLPLAVFAAASCTPMAISPTPAFSPSKQSQPTPSAAPLASPTSPIASYAFPPRIDSSARYLFYVHGRIIEDQGIPAISPEHGEYKYADILATLQSYGFVVISERRLKDTDVEVYAERLVAQVESLVDSGVPPSSITVVGASKGAAIAVLVSNLLHDADLNYVLLGSCHPDMVRDWVASGTTLSGNVLSIYDFADEEFSGSCQDLFTLSEGRGLARHEEIVLQVGTGHGVLYQPLDEWILPTVQWANPAP
jgi:hypothetical protein